MRLQETNTSQNSWKADSQTSDSSLTSVSSLSRESSTCLTSSWDSQSSGEVWSPGLSQSTDSDG